MGGNGFSIIFEGMRDGDSARVVKETEEMRETLDESERIRRLAEIIESMVQAQSNPTRVYTGTAVG